MPVPAHPCGDGTLTYLNVAEIDAAERAPPFALGTKPIRSLTFSGRPLPRPLRESGTLSIAVFWALASFR